MRRSDLPGPRKCRCPTNSSSVRGRMRTASGATRAKFLARTSRKRSMGRWDDSSRREWGRFNVAAANAPDGKEAASLPRELNPLQAGAERSLRSAAPDSYVLARTALRSGAALEDSLCPGLEGTSPVRKRRRSLSWARQGQRCLSIRSRGATLRRMPAGRVDPNLPLKPAEELRRPTPAPPWLALLTAWLGLVMLVASVVFVFLPGSRRPREELERLEPYSIADRFLPLPVYGITVALFLGIV